MLSCAPTSQTHVREGPSAPRAHPRLGPSPPRPLRGRPLCAGPCAVAAPVLVPLLPTSPRTLGAGCWFGASGPNVPQKPGPGPAAPGSPKHLDSTRPVFPAALTPGSGGAGCPWEPLPLTHLSSPYPAAKPRAACPVAKGPNSLHGHVLLFNEQSPELNAECGRLQQRFAFPGALVATRGVRYGLSRGRGGFWEGSFPSFLLLGGGCDGDCRSSHQGPWGQEPRVADGEGERERGGGAWCPTAEPCTVSPGRPLRPGPLSWQNCLSIIVSETEGTDPPPESSAPLLASCSLCLP